MHKLLAKLPAFALPFVTRSLRGGRGRRYALFSLMIAAATALIGFWLALGSGTFEQAVRVELRLEQNEWERQRVEFVVYTHDQYEHEYALEDIRRIRQHGPYDPGTYGEATIVSQDGMRLVEQAALTPVLRQEDQALRDRAWSLVGEYPHNEWSTRFDWASAQQRAMLEQVLDRHAIPEVRRYESPLGLADALKVIGVLAGLLLAACATVFGPLLVALQQAQERHENTLTPLTGTALTPRELALGLAAGPMAVVAIFAAPQLLLFGACALLTGDVIIALALIGSLAATGLFFTFAAQLLGQLVGHRRTPGIVAIALMAVLGIAWLTGAAFLAEADRTIAGLPALLPTYGLAALLARSIGELNLWYFDVMLVATLAWSVAALVFAGLALTALTRKIEARPGPLLDRRAGLLGALTCIGLVHFALSQTEERGMLLYLGLAALALPFTLLLMARVPVGDDPPRMRRVPVPRLLAEFASWGFAHILLAYLAAHSVTPDRVLHPVAMLYIGWCVVVLGLMAIRLVSIPARLIDHLFLGFCAASLLVGFVQAVFWAFERQPSIEHVFALSMVSPVLGLVQVAVTIAVPVLLARSLSKNLRSITQSDPSIPTKTR
jgi:hypothetical protein